MIDVNCIRFSDVEEESRQNDERLEHMHYAIYKKLGCELENYWDKPLGSMPEELRHRIVKAVPNWDDIDSSPNPHVFCHQRSRRQQLIAGYDFDNDNEVDIETHMLIRQFLMELKSRIIIDQNSSKKDTKLARKLRDNVVSPLENILGACIVNVSPPYEIKWFYTGPSLSLWADIYLYRYKTLPSIKAQAEIEGKAGKYIFIDALDVISTQLENILNCGNWMNCKGYELVCLAEAEEKSALVTKEAQAVADIERKALEEAASKNQVVSAAVTKAKIGRPKTIDKKANAMRQIIGFFEKATKIEFNHERLPGSAANLLDACQRLEKNKTGKKKEELFDINKDTLTSWLKKAEYRFPNGCTPTAENNFWTKHCVETMGLITPEVFTDVFDKATP